MVPTVYFNDYNSYSYFNMILYDYTISNAKRKTKFVSIPGRNGELDLSDYFGEVYEDRDINIILYTQRSIDRTNEFQSQLDNLINGKRMKLVFSNDAGYYWNARITNISINKEAKNMIKIVIQAIAYPYKINVITGEEVL